MPPNKRMQTDHKTATPFLWRLMRGVRRFAITWWIKLATASASFLNRRARDGAVRTIYTTVAWQWLYHRSAPLTVIKPLAKIHWHKFGFFMATLRTWNCRLENYVFNLFHVATSVIIIKMSNIGSRTKSRYPIAAVSPITERSATRSGVKQHIAVATVPIIPALSQTLFAAIVISSTP